MSRIKNNPVFRFISELVRRYFGHGISRTGAELAYFFLFSLFPLVIFVTSLIGKLELDMTAYYSEAAYIIPHDVLALFDDYTSYLASIRSDGLMYTGVVLTIYFFSRSVNALHFALNKAYSVTEQRNVAVRLFISILFTMILMVAVLATLILLISGRSLIEAVSELLNIEVYYVNLWNILRFVIACGCFLFALSLMYVVIPNKKIKLKQAMPGAFMAMLAWLAVSIVFSYYVENMGRYSFLYGSIGAIMVLMLWLYLTGVILVLGAEINSVLETFRNKKDEA